MRDLLVIVPSRGRPHRLAAMLDAALGLAEAQTDVVVGLDEDDPSLEGYRALEGRERVFWLTGARLGMPEWTSRLAMMFAGEYRALASLGDDHQPRTPGWDAKLLGALDENGLGIAYGDDLNPRNQHGQIMVTAPVISSEIVTALGWMCLPGISHFYADNVWEDLGKDAGCLYLLPDVVIEHLHPSVTGRDNDATYADAYASWDADQRAFFAWREHQRAIDSETVRKVHDAPR